MSNSAMPNSLVSNYINRQMRLPLADQSLLYRVVALPLAFIYGTVTAVRNLGFDRGLNRRRRLPGAVIAVGNLVVGGTGKSPFVIGLSSYLAKEGYAPAVLTRGYGSGLATNDSAALLGGKVIMPPNDGVHFAPDEARLQSEKLPTVPVIIGARRFQAAQRFLQLGLAKPSHWLLDDGFQHRQLQRDLDVLLLDAESPLGNGHLLPLGTLREPAKAARRADAIVLTYYRQGLSDNPLLSADRSLAEIPRFRLTAKLRPLAAVSGHHVLSGSERVCVVSAIAKPDRFCSMLRELGWQITQVVSFLDHARIDLPTLVRAAEACDVIVTTEKDFWRDENVFCAAPKPVFVLPMALQMDDDEYRKLLGSLLNRQNFEVNN